IAPTGSRRKHKAARGESLVRVRIQLYHDVTRVHFIQGIAELLAPCLVDESVTPRVVEYANHHRNIVKHSLEQFLLPLYLALRPFALGHVPNGGGDEHAFFRAERTEANVNREFAAIFAQAKELQSNPHRTRGDVAKVTAAKVGVLAAKACGNEHLDLVTV